METELFPENEKQNLRVQLHQRRTGTELGDTGVPTAALPSLPTWQGRLLEFGLGETQILALTRSDLGLLSFSGLSFPPPTGFTGEGILSPAPRWLRLGWRDPIDARIPGPPMPPTLRPARARPPRCASPAPSGVRAVPVLRALPGWPPPE